VRLGSSSYKKKHDGREQADPEVLLSKHEKGRQILLFSPLSSSPLTTTPRNISSPLKPLSEDFEI